MNLVFIHIQEEMVLAGLGPQRGHRDRDQFVPDAKDTANGEHGVGNFTFSRIEHEVVHLPETLVLHVLHPHPDERTGFIHLGDGFLQLGVRDFSRLEGGLLVALLLGELLRLLIPLLPALLALAL